MKKQELLRPMAKESQKRRPESVPAKLPKQDTRKQAAKEAGIGERTLDAVK